MTSPTTDRPGTRVAARSWSIAAAIDAALVTLFAAIGRRTHHDDGALLATFKIGAPFLIALAVGWFVMRRARAPFDVMFGVGVWAITLVVGMLLRRFVFDGGTALSFMIVATAFLAATVIGWRVIASVISRRSR